MVSDKDETAPKRRGGRPAQGKRGTFSFRVTEQLRGRLEEEARSLKRPVSEIIEARLERTFAMSDFHEQAEFLNHAVGRAVTRSAGVLDDAPLATPKECRYTITRVILALQRFALSLGVTPLDSIANAADRTNAREIEDLAIVHDLADGIAQRRWSLAFGAWSRVLSDAASTPEEADRLLQERMWAEISKRG